MFDGTNSIFTFIWICLLPQFALFWCILSGIKMVQDIRCGKRLSVVNVVVILLLCIVIFVPTLISMAFLLFPIFAIPTVLAVTAVLLNRKHRSTPEYEYSKRKKYAILFNITAVSAMFAALIIYGGFIYLILALAAFT